MIIYYNNTMQYHLCSIELACSVITAEAMCMSANDVLFSTCVFLFVLSVLAKPIHKIKKNVLKNVLQIIHVTTEKN